MNAELWLESSDPSLLVIEERPLKEVVVGAPHHAPAGTPKLPCPEHEASDENAGFLARHIAEALHCSSIIACNYTIDVNKYPHTDYARQIARWSPRVLIEIHGHAGRKAKYDIEISSGSADNDKYSRKIAIRLAAILTGVDDLKDLSLCGEYSKLYFKARGAVTISDSRWAAYHVELPPKLRKAPGSERPPEIGYRFCDALIKSVKEIHGL